MSLSSPPQQPAPTRLGAAAAVFRASAVAASPPAAGTDDVTRINDEAYEAEIGRINSEALALRHAAERAAGSSQLPPLYLRGRDPVAEEVLRQLRDTSKSFELNLRFREIEKLDRMHAKLWELLSADARACITVDEYKEVMRAFYAWAREEFGEQERDSGLGGEGLGLHADSDADAQGRSRSVSPAAAPPPHNYGDDTPLGRGSTKRRAPSASLQRPVDDSTPLGEVLYLSNVKAPRPTIELFLACPRNNFMTEAVDITTIYQLFAKKVSLVKCEAELIMWDTNNDGRLSEDEMEIYVRDLVPRMAALRNMSEDVLPFYCCTASRRLFWDLDPGNRGVVRIDALLQSAVMDEWVSLQLLTDDNPRNWFGAMATQQLYEKFLLLDKRNEGTLNADNLKRYKKGLPTVLDDGLPPNVSPLSTLFIDRFFETNVMMAKSEMDYRKFVDFVIAVEMLPQCSRPTFLWNIIDLRGDGVVTAMTANYFYRETHAKLVSAGLDVPARETVIQEVFDLIPTASPLRITREEFIKSPQAGLFVALLIDCLSFWAYENREHR